MTLLEFSELLIDLHLYSGLIPVAIALVFWKYQRKEMRVFGINQILSFLIFLMSIILQKQNINNHFIDYIHSIRTLIFVLWMYQIYEQNIKNKTILKILSIGGILLVIIDWGIISKGEWSEFNEIFLSILLTVISIYYLKKLLDTSQVKLTQITLHHYK